MKLGLQLYSVRENLENRRTKGYALDDAYQYIKKNNLYFDAYMIFDADNLLKKDYISKMASAMQQTGAELSCCGIHETTKQKITDYGFDHNKLFSIQDKDTYVEFFNTYWLPVVWNKLYIKDLITEKFDEKIRV